MSVRLTVSFAQNREDVILAGFFKDYETKAGFYVDVGAGSPLTDSVTRLFYEAGWSGINLEPINHIYQALNKHRKRDTNLNIGISNQPGKLQFREYAADGFSTFSKDIQKQYQTETSSLTEKYNDYEVEVMTLEQVFKANKTQVIDFLKIDVEGYEFEVIEGNDWSKYRPRVLCIEANHVKHDWHDILKNNKYKLEHFDGLNEYYVDTHKAITFNYVTALIDKEPIVRYDLALEFSELEKHNIILKKDVARQNTLLADFKYALEQAQAQVKSLEDANLSMNKKVCKSVVKIKKRIIGQKA